MMMYEFIREVLGETGVRLAQRRYFPQIWLLIILDLDVMSRVSEI
jgi:hypothetical protein